MRRVLICPVCGSTEIELESGGYTGKYMCKRCGYIGSFIIEMDEGEYEELKKAREIANFVEGKGEKVYRDEKRNSQRKSDCL